MTVAIISLAGLVALAALAVYHIIIHPRFLSPLAKLPNAHWSSPFCPLWILYHRQQQQDVFAVHAAHQRCGEIVRLAPNEISVNMVDGGIRTVYAGGYEKGDWYSNVFRNYGVMPMFAMPDRGPHSKRKRMLSNIYAKSTLHSSASMTSATRILLRDRLTSRLRAIADTGLPVEWYDIMGAETMDSVNAYIFGLKNGSDFIRDPERCSTFLHDYKTRHKFTFWPQELPAFTAWMSKLGLLGLIVPSWVSPANKHIETWVLEMCDSAEKTLNEMDDVEQESGCAEEDYPTVYAQLRTALVKEISKSELSLPISQIVADNRLEVASEMLDHSMAGFDTSSITLVYLTWELSRPEHKEWQDRLRAEIIEMGDNASAKDIDAAPVLHACLMETLRLHAAIPGNQPRVTPPEATLGTPRHSLGGLPAGVRVNAQAWSLHRNPDVFPEPDTWNPDRWLRSSEEHLKEMGRWFWAFGSGGRMCVGSNLAMHNMKAVMVTVWGQFRTTVVNDEGMAHIGRYVASPIGKDGKHLILKLEELKM